MDDQVEKAQAKFEKEFKYSEMDTMIHRFPPALGDEMNIKYPYMVVPRFVAIGPYHHGKKNLEKMEVVKDAAAAYLCQRIGTGPETAMQKVRDVLDAARGKYFVHDDETAVDTCFAAMMFRDACFLLLYMDAMERSYGHKEDHVVNKSMRRFLFANRDCIESDIMLLENQVPWQVIQGLVDLAKDNYLSQAVVKFITEIGINLKKATPTATFSDMHLERGLLFINRRLPLAPLSLSETTASCLVNMAALEVCTASRFGEHGDKNAVCSYLAVLAFLMVGTEDVRRLRSMGLLHGTHSDGDMLAFFNAVAKHLPSGKNFAFLMGEIQEYKEKRPIRTTLYKWVYNYYVTIIKVVSLIATFIGLYKALSSVINSK